jgi:hypothetical protein
VLVNGSLRDIEDLADLPGGFTSRNPCQHLPLTGGQQSCSGGGPTGQFKVPAMLRDPLRILSEILYGF